MRRSRLIIWLAVGVVLLVAVGRTVIDYRTRPRLLTGPMIASLNPEGFVVVWEWHPATAAGTVDVSHSDGSPVGRFPARLEGGRSIAAVSGLTPATSYRYRLDVPGTTQAGSQADEYVTRTAPLAGGAFRFLALGDGGAGQRSTYRLARLMARYDPDLVIHTGDLNTSFGRAEDFHDRLFQPYAAILARAAVYPCLGNHDVRTANGRPTLDTFLLPENGPDGIEPERFYFFDAGDVRFVALDSNQELPFLRDVAAVWLDRVLADADRRFKVVFWHEPVYTNARHDPCEKMRETIVPVLDRHGVHLALHGHNHLYERTHPIRAGQVAPAGQGTIYITTGAGGCNLYQERIPRLPFIANFYDEQHGFTVVDVTPEMLAVRHVAADTQIVDEFQIAR